MLRKILGSVILLIVMISISNGQANLIYGIFPASNGQINYEKIIPVAGLSKSEIFSKAKQWLASEYKTQKDTAQIEDENLGLLSREGVITVAFNQPATNSDIDWRFQHLIRINATENQAKISISDLELQTPSGYGTITITKVENLKKKLDSLPASAFFGNNTRAQYWQNQLDALKKIDSTIVRMITSFETALSNKPVK